MHSHAGVPPTLAGAGWLQASGLLHHDAQSGDALLQHLLIFFKSAQLSAFQLLRSGTAYTYSPAIAIKISESPRLRLFGLFAAARRWGCSKKLFGQRAGLSSFDETRRLASSALPLHQVHANGRGHSLLMAAAAAAALAALMEPLPDEAALRDRLSERGLKSARAQATATGAAA